MSEDKGIRGKVTRQSQEAVGKVAQGVLGHPVVTRAASAAFETRERATRAQELAMSALNLPSAGDLERLTRRLRSVSQRLESIEDGLDRLEQRIEKLGSSSVLDKRLAAIEELLARLEASVAESAGAGSPGLVSPGPGSGDAGSATGGAAGAGSPAAPAVASADDKAP